MVDISHIKSLATTHGFDLCGVTRAVALEENRKHFDNWLSMGYGEPIEYITRYEDLRFDPSKIIDSAKSVIVCGVSYKNEYSLGSPAPRIASYALCLDYHKTIRKRLKGLLADLQRLYPTLSGRCFTDSAPLCEKQLAVNSGLGWIGRQSLVINPLLGSFILLGEIVINKEVNNYDTPLENVGCGNCRLCIESCPVGAINENRTIDTRRCISCRTVEVDDVTDLTLNGWVFGCDECQSCCPYNKKSPQHTNPDFYPIATPASLDEWRAMDSENFTERYGKTPIKRAGLNRIKTILKKI